MEKPKRIYTKMTLSLHGEALKHALLLKQQREREVGVGQSVAGIVRNALAEKYERDLVEENIMPKEEEQMENTEDIEDSRLGVGYSNTGYVNGRFVSTERKRND